MTRKRKEDEAILLRRLLGESPAAERAELDRRLAAEPALARELAALERSWRALELPPASPPPLGFASRVAALARRSGEGTAGALRLRWASAAALALGIALGTAISAELATPAGGADGTESDVEMTLAESYLDAAGMDEAEAAIGGLEAQGESGESDPEAEGARR